MNSKYTLAMKSTGEVISTATMPTGTFIYDAAMFDCIEDAPDIGDWYANGVFFNKPIKPTAHHAFNYSTKQWEDPRTLDDLKAAQWALIKQARAQAEYAGFTWDGSTLDSDATSQNRITGAVTLAQMSPDFMIGWVLKDNTTRALNQSEMMQVGAALGLHVASQFAKGVLLRAQIDAATTSEEVAAIVW